MNPLTSRPDLNDLRARIAPWKNTRTPTYWSVPGFSPGLPQGAITQVFGPEGCGKTAWVLTLLQENPHRRVAWLEDPLTLYPVVLTQKKIALHNIHFIHTHPQHRGWTLLQLLKSALFPLVIGSGQTKTSLGSPQDIRKLQLACEQSQTSLILVGTEKIQAWSIHTHIQIQNGRPLFVNPANSNPLTQGLS